MNYTYNLITKRGITADPEVNKYVIQEYSKGKSTTVLAAEFDVSHEIMSRILIRNNITRRGPRIHNDVNHDYFEIIDTEAKAYFLGLMFAGADSPANYRFGLTLQ